MVPSPRASACCSRHGQNTRSPTQGKGAHDAAFGYISKPSAGQLHSATAEKAVPRIDEPSVQSCRDREGDMLRVVLVVL